MQTTTLTNYYRFHSRIYDMTRWSFLFGRKQSISYFPFSSSDYFHVLEIGCGTGTLLRHINSMYPKAKIVGVDLSKDMIHIARQKCNAIDMIQIRQEAFDSDFEMEDSLDLILLSYSLSMMPGQWEVVLQKAKSLLTAGGFIVVVDFHSSSSNWFLKWMSYNHVRMDGSLLPILENHFSRHFLKVYSAYAKWWEYLIYIGKT